MDDDFPLASASLAVTPNPVAEGGQVTATVTVTTALDQQPHSTGGSISIITRNVTATAPLDFAAVTRTWTVAARDFIAVDVAGAKRYRATYDVVITTVEDDLREAGETFAMTMSKAGAAAITLDAPTEVSVAIAESADATLSSLSLSGVTLTPTFASGTTTYAADVANSVASTTVAAIPSDAGATYAVKLGGVTDPDGTVELLEGPNFITVEVSAEDGMTSGTYSVIVVRQGAPATGPLLTVTELVKRVRASVVRIDRTGGGTGSGVIFTTIGRSALIATNYHVVGLDEVVTVTVGDQTAYAGAVLGIDAFRDLAVLEICCGDFAAARFGDDGSLEVGTAVVAIGYARGFTGPATVTSGIVSRVFDDSENLRRIVQTDAPLNPGNSGGPLFTLDGLMVGLNTYFVGYEGLGFAVAESTVQDRMPGLLLGHSWAPGYGNISGVLEHDADGLIEEDLLAADIFTADVFSRATFTNPYDAAVNPWSYGISVRAAPVFAGVGADADGGFWFVRRALSNGGWETLGTGVLDDLLTGYGAKNIVEVTVVGNSLGLVVNHEAVALVSLGDASGAGYVGAFTGQFLGDELAGAATRYEDALVFPIYPTGLGPIEVDLLHDDVRTHGAGYGYWALSFWAADAEIGATFSNPYDAATAAWDYGLRFRDDRNSGEALLFNVHAGPSGAWWRLIKIVVDGDSDTDLVLTHGSLAGLDFNTGDGDKNRLRVRAAGGVGTLYVNGTTLGSFNIGAVTRSGFAAVMTGYLDTVAGETTEVEDFTASRITSP